MDSLSRRSFLKGACAATAAATLPGLFGGDSLLIPRDVFAAAKIPSKPAMQQILRAALKRGGNYADLYLETRINTQINLSSSEITGMEYGILQGGGVHVVNGEKSGYAFAETLKPEDLTASAETASQIADGGRPKIMGQLRKQTFDNWISCSQPLTKAAVTEKVALLDRIDKAARAVDPSISQVTVSYTDTTQSFTVASSEGHLAEDELPMIYLRINVTATRGGEMAQGSFRTAARLGMEFFTGDMPEQSARQAAEQAVRMLDARPAPSGEFPVVIAAGGGVMFHEAVGHGLEADGVLRGATVFADRVGEKVASEIVTLYDGAAFADMRGSFNVDDEGVAASNTCLIEKGILKGYMHNQKTAKAMGVTSTGNGRRQSYRYPALPRMSNTYVTPGEYAPEEVIKRTKSGIYAVDFGGGEVDTASGQFTFGLREAYLIEDGKITAPIKGANLTGSGPEVLQRIDLVGSDYDAWPGTCGKSDQWVPVTSCCPTLRIAGITVGGTA
jgi:TldD protein